MTNTYTPAYADINAIKATYPQIRYSNTQGEGISDTTLNMWIVFAETAVEQSLRILYQVPFTSIASGTFAGLNANTKNVILALIDRKIVTWLFSSGFFINNISISENYLNRFEKQYNDIIREQVGITESKLFIRPVLADLALNPNTNLANTQIHYNEVIMPNHAGTVLDSDRVISHLYNPNSLKRWGNW